MSEQEDTTYSPQEGTTSYPVDHTLPASPYDPYAGSEPHTAGSHVYPYPEYGIGVPPPPPQTDIPSVYPNTQKKPRRALVILGVSLAIALLLFASAGLFYLARTYAVNKAQPTPTVRFVPVTSTSAPTQPATPAPTAYANYTASDIMADFLHAGLPIENTVYNNTIWDWSGQTYFIYHHATSSVQWDDNSSQCSQYNCYGLWVYQDSATASQVYSNVISDEQAKGLYDPVYQHGSCVLLAQLGQPSPTAYWRIVQKYCI